MIFLLFKHISPMHNPTKSQITLKLCWLIFTYVCLNLLVGKMDAAHQDCFVVLRVFEITQDGFRICGLLCDFLDKICFAIYLFFFVFPSYFGGFNYSKIANWWFLMDSDTFWMIFGTSKMFTKSGLVHPVFITKSTSKI